jgi:hypothetical protein
MVIEKKFEMRAILSIEKKVAKEKKYTQTKEHIPRRNWH